MSEQQKSYPSGLTRLQLDELGKSVDAAAHFGPGVLLDEAEAHLQTTRQMHSSNVLVNVRLAEAIVGVVHTVVAEWDRLPADALPWLRGAIYYFSKIDFDEPDFTSPIGFEDDAEILNACLRLAGRNELCLNPEDYDDI